MTRRRNWQLLTALLLACRLASPASAYIAEDRWTRTATDGSLTGVATNPPTPGRPVTLTWSIVPDGTIIPGNTSGTTVPSNLVSFLDTNLGAGPGGADYSLRPWFHIFQESFDRLSALSGVTYVYEPNDDAATFSQSNSGRGILGTRGDVRLSGKSYGAGSNTLASNFYPDYSDMMINTDKSGDFKNSVNNYREFRNTVMHESMHGLGISHVDSTGSNFLIEPILGTSFDGPQLDDLLAIQRLYGDFYEKNGGNDTAANATPLGSVSLSQPEILGSLGNTVSIAGTATDFLSIDDDSDVDYFSFTIADPLNVQLSLSPRGATYNVGPQDGTQSSFNTLALSNLSLALIGPNGATTITSSNVNGAGLGEAILRDLDPGTYYARITGAQNDIQLYQIAMTAQASDGDNLSWIGNQSTTWDVNSTENFHNSVSADLFRNGDSVSFGAAGLNQNINIQGDVAPASLLVNAGVYTFAGPGRIVDGSVIVDSGGELVLANSGNSYAGTTSVFNGTLRITGDANAMVSPITVAFGGTLVLDPTDAAGMASAFTVQPGGVMEIGTPATDANVLPDNPASIVDDGVIRIYDSELIRNVSGAGQIILAGETSQFAANSTFAGQTSVSAGAALEIQDDEALGTSQASAIVEDGGVIEVNLPAQLPVNFTLKGAGTGNGALRVGPSTLASFDGHIGVAAASTIQVQSDAIARFNGAVDSSSGGNLTVDVQSGGQAVFGGAVSLESGGLVKTGGGQATLLGNYGATGMTEVQAGTLEAGATGQLVGEFKVASDAELHVANPDAFASTAKLTGNGTIVGSLNYSGAVAPGGAIGALTLAGDLSLSAQSVVQLELSGLAPTIEYDQLHITAASALDGALEVLLTDEFMPGPGDSFALLTAGEVTGQFATAVLPVLNPGLTWDLDYLTNEVLLSVSAVPVFAPADFNVDGAVDGADLAVWQGSFGLEPAAHAQGDADGDGMISGADFLVWQRQLADLTAMATSAAVPEPDRWALLASSSLALAGLIHFHRQRT